MPKRIEQSLNRRQFPAIHGARRRCRRERHASPCRRAARARRGRQDRRAASGLRRAVLFRPAGPHRRQIAIEEINAAGGIKALGGAKIEAVLGDAQSTPDGGNAEVEKMNSAGVAAIVGGYASGICLAASQTAARYDLPYIVDVGVVDSIVTRGLKNTFRFGPGFGVIAKTAIDNLVAINDQAGKPAKTVMIVHEDSAFGSGLAKLLNAQLPRARLPDSGNHPASDADARLQQCRAQDQGAEPRLVIPANYYNEYVLLARTMQQQQVRPKGIYSVLGGAASSYKFVKEFPEAAQYIMDCNHWFDPQNPKALELKKKVEAQGRVLHLRSLHELLAACCCWPMRSSAPAAPTAPRSSPRWRARPSPATSCLTARPSSSTARTRARRRSTPR